MGVLKIRPKKLKKILWDDIQRTKSMTQKEDLSDYAKGRLKGQEEALNGIYLMMFKGAGKELYNLTFENFKKDK